VALANYDELIDALSDWLSNAPVARNIPQFIRLAEAKLEREIRCRYNQAFISGVFNAATEPLPADFVDISSLSLISPRRGLVYYPHEAFFAMTAQDEGGSPKYVTFLGSNLHLAPVPTGSYDYTLAYYTTIPSLQTSSTNWLIDVAPDVYLYASLSEAEPFLKNDARLAMWKEMRNAGIELLNGNDRLLRSRGLGQRARAM
jgi:hypothetical protein